MLLQVKNLNVESDKRSQKSQILSDLNFELSKGEILGIIGESGSGKTITALSILNLLPNGLYIKSGKILFDDLELNTLSEDELFTIRGKRIAMITQESLLSLNPLLTVGFQISEMMISHLKFSKTDSKLRSLELLKIVGFERPEEIYLKYPHELSGGMRQRIIIAIGISLNPEILIADEPTSSLDINSENEIITLLKKINHDFGTSIIFITHNLNLANNFCDRVIVMYNSQIIESSTTKELFTNPKQEYTKKLVSSK